MIGLTRRTVSWGDRLRVGLGDGFCLKLLSVAVVHGHHFQPSQSLLPRGGPQVRLYAPEGRKAPLSLT